MLFKTFDLVHLSALISSLPFLPPFHTICWSNLWLQKFRLLAFAEYAMFTFPLPSLLLPFFLNFVKLHFLMSLQVATGLEKLPLFVFLH